MLSNMGRERPKKKQKEVDVCASQGIPIPMSVKPMFYLSFAHLFILSSQIFHVLGVPWLLGNRTFPKAVYFSLMYRYIQT